jgi:hypothetical protein
MLWELTLSFKVLPAPATAAILATFVIAATALAWKRNLAPVLWMANIAAAAAALALSVATHLLVPFIATLLLMALISEFAAARNHQQSVRFLPALAADAAIWALIFIYSSPAWRICWRPRSHRVCSNTPSAPWPGRSPARLRWASA